MRPDKVVILKLVQIVNSQVYVIETRWPTAEEARKHFAPNIEFEDAPDWVGIGFTFVPSATTDEERWLKPGLPEGWSWDDEGNPWEPELSRENERKSLISEVEPGLLEAYRKLRAGDTTCDWSAKVSEIEAYIEAVEKTKEQEGYPEKVIYPAKPEYPTKP